MQPEAAQFVVTTLTEYVDAKVSQALGVCQLLNALPRGELPAHVAGTIWAVVELLQQAHEALDQLQCMQVKQQSVSAESATFC